MNLRSDDLHNEAAGLISHNRLQNNQQLFTLLCRHKHELILTRDSSLVAQGSESAFFTELS